MKSLWGFIFGLMFSSIVVLGYLHFRGPAPVPPLPAPAPVPLPPPPLVVEPPKAKTIDELVEEKAGILRREADDKIQKSLLPIQQEAEKRIQIFSTELISRMDQDTITLARRQAAPNMAEIADLNRQLDREFSNCSSRGYCRHSSATITPPDGSAVNRSGSTHDRIRSASLSALKAKLETREKDLIRRFKEHRRTKNHEKINAYAEKIDAIVIAARDAYEDYYLHVMKNEVAVYRAKLEGHEAPAIEEMKPPVLKLAFPDPVDPDKGRFIYQDFK